MPSLLAAGFLFVSTGIVTACALPSTERDIDRRDTSGIAVAGRPGIRSMALRVHHLDAMTSFYGEAFGIEFEEVVTSGIASRFGTVDGITIKLVPIREATDFVGYPDAQLGFEVSDVRRVIELAQRFGGRREGDVRQLEGLVHAAVRDPDGNTIELYQRR